MSKENMAEKVSKMLIDQLRQGTAPWQKPWSDQAEFMPHNPQTGNRYHGINAINLMATAESKGYSDTRWMTYKQAQEVGAHVNKGEKGTQIEYWKFSDTKLLKDENGKPVLDEKGEKKTVSYQLERPQVFVATVFNAEQIDGLPELKKSQVTWDRNIKAENILTNSGAEIIHKGGDRAYYSSTKDHIVLPERAQFESDDKYYATALHELGHWTGHKSRLDRDLANPFGSTEYAKEELKAEISSMMVGSTLGIGHDPGQHASYVGSWIKVLQDDPQEIFRAARDAEKIHDYVMKFEQKIELGQSADLQNDIKNEQTKKHEYLIELQGGFGKSNFAKSYDDPKNALEAAEWLADKNNAVMALYKNGEKVLDTMMIETDKKAAWDEKIGGEFPAKQTSFLYSNQGLWDGQKYVEDAKDAKLYTNPVEAFSEMNKMGKDNVVAMVRSDNYGMILHNMMSTNEQAAKWEDSFKSAYPHNIEKFLQAEPEAPKKAEKEAATNLSLPEGLNSSFVQILKQSDLNDWGDINKERREDIKLELETMFAGKASQHDINLLTDHVSRFKNVESEMSEPKIAQDKTFLAVRFKEKSQASELGARWDKVEKSWYAEAGADLNKFSKWMPNSINVRQGKGNSVEEFGAALEKSGFILNGLPKMDGKLHRAKVEGDREGEMSGSYKGFTDGRPAGFIQNFRTGYKANWRATGAKISQEEAASIKADALNKRLERDQQLDQSQKQKAGELQQKWSAFTPAPNDHPYLLKKRIEPNGAKVNERGDLVIPAMDTSGKIWSMQRIDIEGNKAFEKGAKKQGMFFTVGHKQQDSKNVFIAEGFATAASIAKATGQQVHVAFDAGNLKNVAMALKEQNPDKRFTIFADNDHSKKQNVGIIKATEAAKAVGGVTVVPLFLAASKRLGFTDFNDLANTVSKDISAAMQMKGLNAMVESTHETKERQVIKQALEKTFGGHVKLNEKGDSVIDVQSWFADRSKANDVKSLTSGEFDIKKLLGKSADLMSSNEISGIKQSVEKAFAGQIEVIDGKKVINLSKDKGNVKTAQKGSGMAIS